MRLATHQERLESLIPATAAKTYERPDRRCAVIIFTPRSGSSWLSELLSSTGVFGYPNEHAQHFLLEHNTKFFARTETDYLNAFEQEVATPNKVFSIEITWGDIERFGTIDFLDRYAGATFYVLRRNDIIAQAVSIHLAVSTGLFHKTGAGEIRITPEESPEVFASIRRWVVHLVNYEYNTEMQLACRGINPVRFSYEDIVIDSRRVVAKILSAMEIENVKPPSSTFQRVSSPDSARLAASFKSQNADFVSKVMRLRPSIWL
jgi:LPS sulfotransferase NodH